MPRSINHCFAGAIYRARISRGMTQQQVADFLGRTKRWYQKIECGHSKPNLSDTLLLMALFQIDATELIKEAGGHVSIPTRSK